MTILVIVLLIAAFIGGIEFGMRLERTPFDDGPWDIYSYPKANEHGVISFDFEHDVMLRVSGDFEDEDAKREYCKWLARLLNEAGEPTT